MTNFAGGFYRIIKSVIVGIYNVNIEIGIYNVP
jgi:hypothetical protein